MPYEFDPKQIEQRRAAMDNFKKSLTSLSDMEMKKKEIEFNNAKKEQMDAKILQTRHRTQQMLGKLLGNQQEKTAGVPQSLPQPMKPMMNNQLNLGTQMQPGMMMPSFPTGIQPMTPTASASYTPPGIPKIQPVKSLIQ